MFFLAMIAGQSSPQPRLVRATGSKLLYWVEDPHRIITHWNNFQIVWGGKTIVGGLIGGFNRGRMDQKEIENSRTDRGFILLFHSAWELQSGGLAVFLAGLEDDTYGQPTNLPWGIDFGDGTETSSNTDI